ncbi:hypothetical protein FDECE_15347, partial [Fusarium decemcellulare]
MHDSAAISFVCGLYPAHFSRSEVFIYALVSSNRHRILCLVCAMEYFHILEHYRLIVCQICRYAVTPDRVATHLRQAPHQLTWEEAQQASSWASSLDLANRIQPGDGSIPPVPDTSLPLTHLGPPRSGGFRCTANEGTCRYVASSIRRIREHGRHAHGFNSHSRGGRPRKKHAIASPIGLSSCPGVDACYWRTGVLYQRFF